MTRGRDRRNYTCTGGIPDQLNCPLATGGESAYQVAIQSRVIRPVAGASVNNELSTI
jgi:hypothetical protein